MGGVNTESNGVAGDKWVMVLYSMFIFSQSLVTLSHSKPAFAGTSCDICHAQGNDRRDAVWLHTVTLLINGNTGYLNYEMIILVI
jgi:hypothetical protein